MCYMKLRGVNLIILFQVIIDSIYYIDVNSNHQNKKIAVMENQHGEELIRLD